MSHSLAPSEISRKVDEGIHGPPFWFKFFKRKGIYGPPIWSEFLKGDEGIHGPPIWSEFLKGKGSTDRRFGSNFQKG